MKTSTLFFFSGLLALVSACSGDSPDNPSPNPPVPGGDSKREIKISASISASRASDNGFDNGDAVGLFVANYADGNPSALKNSGNHADNARFYYNGSWTPDQTLYWKDETTRADLYLYYPYDKSFNSVTEYAFAVKTNQSESGAFAASDFLAGKAAGINPTSGTVNISVSHLMSQIRVTLQAGDGYTADDLAAANPAVTLNRLRTQASINLSQVSASATGKPADLTPAAESKLQFKALVPPQSVEEGPLVTVRVDDREYVLTRAIDLQGGKAYNLTVTVSKTQNGINVSISPWVTEDENFGGVAE